jgi:hypothetical protein
LLVNIIEGMGLKMIPASESQTDKEYYWRHELRSLGIEPKRHNELNDKEELAALTDNIKQVYYQDYKTAYDENQDIDKSNFDHII